MYSVQCTVVWKYSTTRTTALAARADGCDLRWPIRNRVLVRWLALSAAVCFLLRLFLNCRSLFGQSIIVARSERFVFLAFLNFSSLFRFVDWLFMRRRARAMFGFALDILPGG